MEQFGPTNQQVGKLKNIKILIFTGVINLFFGITGNVLGDDYCSAAPTSSLFVKVKDKGAKGDGITDDTVAIQATVDQIAGTGGTVLVPDGTYLINAITSIQIKSDMTLRMSTETLLKALPNDNTNYSIINITGASNINVINGTLVGERDEHLGVQFHHVVDYWRYKKHDRFIDLSTLLFNQKESTCHKSTMRMQEQTHIHERLYRVLACP